MLKYEGKRLEDNLAASPDRVADILTDATQVMRGNAASEADIGRDISDQTRFEIERAGENGPEPLPPPNDAPMIIAYSTGESTENSDDQAFQRSPIRLEIAGRDETFVYDVTTDDFNATPVSRHASEERHSRPISSRRNSSLRTANVEQHADRSGNQHASNVRSSWFGSMITKGLDASPKIELGSGSGQSFETRVKSNEERIRELESDVHVMPEQGVIAAGINTKGDSGKTTTVAFAANLMARTRANTYVVDLNRQGVIEARFRMGSSLTIKTLSSKVKQELEDYRIFKGSEDTDGQLSTDAITKIRRQIPYDRENGVRIISADKSHNLIDRFDDKDVDRVLDTVDILADHQFYDLGNVLNDPTVLAALRRTNVFIFSANVASEETLWQLQTSMQELRNLEDGVFSERVDRSIVVLHGLMNVDGVKYLIDRYLSNLEANGDGSSKHTHQGVVIAIPFIEKLSKECRTPLDISVLQPQKKFGKTDLAPYEAYQRLIIAILEERKRQIDEGIDYTKAR